MYKILVKIIKILIWAFFILFVIIPYLWSIVFWQGYKSKAVFIPATHEKIYLITYQSRVDGMYNTRVEVSKCDWRIFNSSKREYWYHELYNNPLPLYYKVSNDTLYLLLKYSVDPPPDIKMKTKVVQIPLKNYISKEKPYGWSLDYTSKKGQLYFEKMGFTKFP